ncbi:MAG TPA: hypothetical protein VJL35_12155 [Gemmatimonadaceae bacterium]|nr:hypothetical protein [Gemmatimonadaceae bacterium]
MKVFASSSRRMIVFALACTILAAAKPAAAYFAVLSSFNIAQFSITAGNSASGKAVLTSTTKSPIPIVSFKSSNAAVAGVPTSKAADMYGNVNIPINGLSAGCATVTATYGGVVRSDDIIVHPAVTTTAFGFTVPDSYVPWPASIKGTLTKTLSLSSTPTPTGARGTLTIERAVWKLSSSNTAVARVPDSVEQVDQVTTFPIYGKADGCAFITAKLGTASITRAVKVIYIGG